MAEYLSRLAGTLASAFRLGTLRLKDVSGALVLRDSSDTTNAGLEVASIKITTGAANGKVLMSDANGSASWGAAGSGGTLVVEEEDGTPSVAGVDTLKVTNGTLTDNEDGSVTIDVGGGGDGNASSIQGTAVDSIAPGNHQLLECHYTGDVWSGSEETVGNTSFSGSSTSSYNVQEIYINLVVKGKLTALNFNAYGAGSNLYAEVWNQANTVKLATTQTVTSVVGVNRLPFSDPLILPVATYRVKFYRSPNLKNLKGYNWTTTKATTSTLTNDIPPCSVEAYWKTDDATLIEWVSGPNGLRYAYDNVSNPPTDTELDAAFGQPAEVGAGFARLLDDNGGHANVYLVASDGASWWYTSLTKAT